jgi:hypothetical protein
MAGDKAILISVAVNSAAPLPLHEALRGIVTLCQTILCEQDRIDRVNRDVP